MRWIYCLLFYIAMPFIWLRLLWRARRNPDYAKRWSERLGHIPFIAKPNSIWWHAVSVGETLAAIPLINAFQMQHPDIPIVVTTTTPTASKQVQMRLGNRVQHVYAPYDLPHVIRRFLSYVKPRMLIIMETELWPNLLHICHYKNIPIFIANARLSQKSASGYAKLGRLTYDMLQKISLLAAQNRVDADRFIKLGLPINKLKVTGTTKFDITISGNLVTQAKMFRQGWGESRPVWIAASTHPGEEEIILQAMQKILIKFPETLLILVPRHPDRTKEVIALCQETGLEICSRQSQKPIQTTTQIFLIDTLGELLLFYAAADIAFVGGSLIERGGHNILEPAALGLPIITGKSMFNFSEIARLFLEQNALHQVSNAIDLSEQIIDLFSNPSYREKMGHAGLNIIAQNRGATEKQLTLIQTLIVEN